MRRRTLSRRTLSRRTLSRRTLSRRTLSRRTLSRRTLSRSTLRQKQAATEYTLAGGALRVQGGHPDALAFANLQRLPMRADET